MNRVKRVSEKYGRQRPEINKLRERNRRARLINKMKHRKGPNWHSEGPADLPGTTVDLTDLTVKELRGKAKVLGLTGYSKLRKDDLISAIERTQGEA